MDFFAQQDRARRQTGLMLILFAAAVAAIIAALYKVIGFLLLYRGGPAGFDPRLLGIVAAAVLALVGLGSLYKIRQLRQGGGAGVAELLGGRLLSGDAATADGHEQRLLNVVEEMAIASGVPIPAVYVLDEDGINAFAAGFTPADAVVTVTRGCLRKLTRDELQGVVAHEFSHILNGDMRLNIRLMGLVHGILLIALIGANVLRFSFGGTSGSSRSRRSGGPFVLLAVALMIIGYIGVFFANLIKAAVSRNREFLADSSAVQFTRNPSGIAGALKKIGGLNAGSGIGNEHAAELSHFYFARGIEDSLFSIFSTHPPLAQRVKRLEPGFRGAFPEIPGDFLAPLDEEIPVLAAGFARGASGAHVAAGELVASVGTMTADGINYAAALLKALPPELFQAARTGDGARVILLGMLFDARPEIRTIQRQLLGLEQDATPPAAVEGLLPALDALEPRLRLPLADVAVASLRTLGEPSIRCFTQEVEALVSADGRITLFELMLATMIGRRLRPLLGPPDRGIERRGQGGSLLQGCTVIFSAFARASSAKQGAIHRVYDLGAREFFGERRPEILSVQACRSENIRQALERVRQAPAQVKKRILGALARMALADTTVSVEEAELLRTVADGLGCPVPPLTGS
ncbi:MAG: M48 family metallopeptidase [Candidatus Methylomirabilia bacterium]